MIMKKNNSLFLAIAILCSVIGGVIAQDIEQSFRESTQCILKETAVYYVLGYGVLHYFATGLAPLWAMMSTDLERSMAKARGEKFPLGKTVVTFGKELREGFLYMNKGLIRSHRIVAPVVFGSAFISNTLNMAENMAGKK